MISVSIVRRIHFPYITESTRLLFQLEIIFRQKENPLKRWYKISVVKIVSLWSAPDDYLAKSYLRRNKIQSVPALSILYAWPMIVKNPPPIMSKNSTLNESHLAAKRHTLLLEGYRSKTCM